jgi:hypothetical protein
MTQTSQTADIKTAAKAEKPVAAKAKAKPATKMKIAKAAEKPAKEKPLSKRAEILAKAEAGILPAAPDFSANTHKPYRKKLEALVALVEAGDMKGLKAYLIKPISSSPKALDKFRNLAATALEAQKKAAKPA